MNARAQEEQNQNQEQVPQDDEEETTNHNAAEGGRTEDDGSSGPVHECCKRKSAASSNNEPTTPKSPNNETEKPTLPNNDIAKPTEPHTEIAKPTVPAVENDTDSKPPPTATAIDQKSIPTKPSGTTVPSFGGLAGSDAETPAFPAFYRVVRDSGASVYRDETDDPHSCHRVIRIVPCGVVFVGMKLEYRKCVLTKQMMVQMPDGWVNESCVERIVAVPLQS